MAKAKAADVGRWILTILLLVWVATGSRVALVISMGLIFITIESVTALLKRKKII